MARDRKGALGLSAHAPRDRVTSELLLRELLAALSAELGRAVARGNELSVRLENIAEDAVDSIADVQLDDAPAELAYRAHRLRGVVLNALLVLADFQLVAGKLEAIAALRQACARD